MQESVGERRKVRSVNKQVILVALGININVKETDALTHMWLVGGLNISSISHEGANYQSQNPTKS